MSESMREILDVIAKVLLRCWIIGFCIQLMTFFGIMIMSGVLYEIYASLFDLTVHESNLIIVAYMSLIKLFVTIFFFIPWLAIWLLLNKTTEKEIESA